MAIIKRKNKSKVTYQVKLRGTDGIWIGASFESKRDAEKYEIELKHKMGTGGVVTSKAKKITVNDFFSEWEQSMNTGSPGWQKDKVRMYHTYIEPLIGDMHLSKVLPAHVSKILTEMEKLGRGEQMQLHVYGLLLQIFTDASESFYYISRIPVNKDLRPKVHEKEAKSLKIDQIVKLLVHTRDKYFGLAVWLQLFCALRACEVVYLKWKEHIDFEIGYLYVHGTYRRKEQTFQDYPKGGEEYRVKIPSEMLEFLKERYENSTSEFVVPSEDQSTFMDYNIYYKKLKKFYKELGFDPKLATHSLKHSVHALYMSLGATEEDIQALMNHKDISTTRKYIHGGYVKEDRIDLIATKVNLGISSHLQ